MKTTSLLEQGHIISFSSSSLQEQLHPHPFYDQHQKSHPYKITWATDKRVKSQTLS